MSLTNCNFRFSCTVLALIAGVILGVIAAFAQITGVITVTPVFLWVAFGIAVVTLWVLVIGTTLARRCPACVSVVSSLLAGILGTILLAVVLQVVGIVATSVVSAILVGLLVLFLTLTFVNTACFVRCMTACDDQ